MQQPENVQGQEQEQMKEGSMCCCPECGYMHWMPQRGMGMKHRMMGMGPMGMRHMGPWGMGYMKPWHMGMGFMTGLVGFLVGYVVGGKSCR